MALGDAMLGAPLTRSLGLDRDSARETATQMLVDAAIVAGLGPAEAC